MTKSPTSGKANDFLNAKWLENKIRATLSHYPSDWKTPEEVASEAMDDWIDFLSPFSRPVIEQAFASYLKNEPSKRPTPGEIRLLCRNSYGAGDKFQPQGGDRDSLSPDQRDLLEHKVLPKARKWLSTPGLASHGRQTLAFWGEPE